MGQIIYEVISGEFPITVSLIGSGEPNNVHNAYEQGSFTGIDAGTYTLRFIDNDGCIQDELLDPCGICATGYAVVGNGCVKYDTTTATEYLPLKTIEARSHIEYSNRGTLIFDT